MELVAGVVLSVRAIKFFNQSGQGIAGKTFCIRSWKVFLKRQIKKFTVASTNTYLMLKRINLTHGNSFTCY